MCERWAHIVNEVYVIWWQPTEQSVFTEETSERISEYILKVNMDYHVE